MNYDTFYNLFLTEMPQRAPGINGFQAQLEMIQENLDYDVDVISVSAGVFKIDTDEQTTYWVGNKDATTVSIIVDTTIDGNFCKVVLSSKNPTLLPGSKPYASDLYLIIKEDIKPYHLVFTSDELLSDDGERLWKGLIKRGNPVSVYDTSTHKYVLSPVDNEQDLTNYIGGPDKRKYVFILSESQCEQRGIIGSFAIMEIKRNAGYPLFDHLMNKRKQC